MGAEKSKVLAQTAEAPLTNVSAVRAVKRGYWTSEEGLQTGVAKLKAFFEKNQRAPTTEEAASKLNLGGLLAAIRRGTFKGKGIKGYNDFLKFCGLPKNYEPGIWTTDEIFQKVVGIVKEFYKKNDRAPTTNELSDQLNLGGFIESVQRGTFKGINSYGDFLKFCGLPVNLERNIWTSEEGLQKAASIVMGFYTKNNRAPTYTEASKELHLSGFIDTIGRGMFKDKGIRTYVDFLKFLKVPPNYEVNIWNTEKGFQDGVSSVKGFYERHSRAPTKGEAADQLHLSGFIDTIGRGVFKDKGIKTYNDFLKSCKMPPNLEQSIWRSDRKFWEAVNSLKHFYEEHSRAPRRDEASSQLHLGGFLSAIFDHRFKSKGINTYNDLLKFCDIPLTKTWSSWHTEEGFQKGVKGIKEFYEKHGRTPTTRELRLEGFINAVYRGVYTDKGIRSYTDLARYVGALIDLESKIVLSSSMVKRYLARSKAVEYDITHGYQRAEHAGAVYHIRKDMLTVFSADALIEMSGLLKNGEAHDHLLLRKGRLAVVDVADVAVLSHVYPRSREVDGIRPMRSAVVNQGRLSDVEKEAFKIFRAVAIRKVLKGPGYNVLIEGNSDYIDTYMKYVFPSSVVLFKQLLHREDLKGKSVLDIGCGVGAPLLYMLKNMHADISTYTGIDGAESVVRYNRELYDENFHAETFPYVTIKGRYDHIVLSKTLDYMRKPDIFASILTAHRLLNAGGSVTIVLTSGRREEFELSLRALSALGYDGVTSTDAVDYTYKLDIISKKEEHVYIIVARKSYDFDVRDIEEGYKKVGMALTGKVLADASMKSFADSLYTQGIPFFVEGLWNVRLGEVLKAAANGGSLNNAISTLKKKLQEHAYLLPATAPGIDGLQRVRERLERFGGAESLLGSDNMWLAQNVIDGINGSGAPFSFGIDNRRVGAVSEGIRTLAGSNPINIKAIKKRNGVQLRVEFPSISA